MVPQVNWSYDGIYRLTNETISLAPSKNNGSVGYGLDPVGNRLSESSSLPDILSGSWSFNADDELPSETYDANGNVTSSGGKAFTYDSGNHLVSMSASGTSATLVYDGFGNRVSNTDGDPVNVIGPRGREAYIESLFTTTDIRTPLR